MVPINFPNLCRWDEAHERVVSACVLMHDAKYNRVRLINAGSDGAPHPGSIVLPDSPDVLRDLAKTLNDFADYQEKVRSNA